MTGFVQNGTGRTHLDLLRTLIAGTDQLLITSPFLAADLGSLSAKLNLQHLGKLTLITVAPSELPLRAQWLASLVSLLEFQERWKAPAELIIETSPRLHGKAYVMSQGGNPYAALISSANFTRQGLLSNAEWGLATRDERQIQALMQAIMNEPRSRLAADWIRSEAAKLKHLLTATIPPEPFVPSERSIGEALRRAEQVWLKPWGVSENPVVEGEKFDQPVTDLHFSKARPSGVAAGDLMILHGIGAQRLLGIFEVAGQPEKATEAEIAETPWKERWPWYVPGVNLTPRFGAEWWLHELWTAEIVKVYQDPGKAAAITAAGGNSLGALNWGADKIRLSDAFAEYLVSLIADIETRLAGQ